MNAYIQLHEERALNRSLHRDYLADRAWGIARERSVRGYCEATMATLGKESPYRAPQAYRVREGLSLLRLGGAR